MALVYLNGNFIPADKALISPFDRGFLFADSIYEVTAILGGKLIDGDAHYNRMARSCAELEMTCALDHDNFLRICRKLAAENKIEEGVIYIQQTRGAAPRQYEYDGTEAPTAFGFAQAKSIIDHPMLQSGMTAALLPDTRWARCDIKTTQLLSQVMLKTQAHKSGADDVILTRGSYIAEGGSNNVFAVTASGEMITPPATQNILSGITRARVIKLADLAGLTCAEDRLTIEDLLGAPEVFISSTSTIVLPVVKIDGQRIGNGRPGAVATQLRSRYLEWALGRNP